MKNEVTIFEPQFSKKKKTLSSFLLTIDPQKVD